MLSYSTQACFNLTQIHILKKKYITWSIQFNLIHVLGIVIVFFIAIIRGMKDRNSNTFYKYYNIHYFIIICLVNNIHIYVS